MTQLAENLRATGVAPELTDEEVRALTATEDETTATLDTMPDQMLAALQRRRQSAD